MKRRSTLFIIYTSLCTSIGVQAGGRFTSSRLSFFDTNTRSSKKKQKTSGKGVHATQTPNEAIDTKVKSACLFDKNNVMREHIQLKTADGLLRPGVLTLRKDAVGTILLSHPAAYNKEFFIPFEPLMFQQYNTLSFDYRRHGEHCDDQYSTLGRKETLEVQAAVEYLRQHEVTKEMPLFGLGISMGAVTLIEAESHKPMFDGLILQAPYDSLKSQISRLVSFFQWPMMRSLIMSPMCKMYAKIRFRLKLSNVRPVKSIKNISTPIFLIHAQDDPTVHFTAFQKLKKAAKSIIETWTPLTGKHTSLFKQRSKEYAQRCLAFLKRIGSRKKNREGQAGTTMTSQV